MNGLLLPRSIFDFENKVKKLKDLNIEINDKDFWNNPIRAQKVSIEASTIEKLISSLENLETNLSDIKELIEITGEDNLNENDYEGLRLLVRGNGENYNIHIRTGMTFMPWQYYSVEFKTSPNWNEIIIPFSNFKRSNFYQPRGFKSKDIATLGIVAYGRDYEADIDLAKIEFY